MTLAIRRVRTVTDQYSAQYPARTEELNQDRWELSKLLDDLGTFADAYMRLGRKARGAQAFQRRRQQFFAFFAVVFLQLRWADKAADVAA